jgi:hypothetical protein
MEVIKAENRSDLFASFVALRETYLPSIFAAHGGCIRSQERISTEITESVEHAEFHAETRAFWGIGGDPPKAFSFAFFAASREKNLLSKFALNCGYSPCHAPMRIPDLFGD